MDNIIFSIYVEKEKPDSKTPHSFKKLKKSSNHESVVIDLNDIVDDNSRWIIINETVEMSGYHSYTRRVYEKTGIVSTSNADEIENMLPSLSPQWILEHKNISCENENFETLDGTIYVDSSRRYTIRAEYVKVLV